MDASNAPDNSSGAHDTLGRHAALPVTVIALPVESIQPESGDSRLITGLARFGVLPVTDRKRRLLGVVQEQDLLTSADLGRGDFWKQEALVAALKREPVYLRLTDRIEQAIRLFSENDQALIPLVDAQGRYTGQCASRRRLLQLAQGTLRPVRMGGLATPLGVYMTSGVYSSGSGTKGLVATGILFGLLAYPLSWAEMVLYSVLVSFLPDFQSLSPGNQVVLQQGLFLVLVLALLRLSPLAGLHAAEHMTINAMENDLNLTKEVVRTQPREHWRCGTNFMVLLGGLMVIVLSTTVSVDRISPLGLALYAMLWFGLLLKYWRPVGLWLQRHFTTKNPTDAQLESGLKAGRELLEKFRAHPHPMPDVWTRIWGAGITQMMAAFWITLWVLERLLGTWLR